MTRFFSNVRGSGVKRWWRRLRFGDVVLIGLVIYSFTVAVISQAQSSSQELHRASIAVVDEDGVGGDVQPAQHATVEPRHPLPGTQLLPDRRRPGSA